MMEAKVAIAVMAAYAGIYYMNGRRLLSQLREIDREYYEYLGAQGGVGASNSIAIIKLLFDGDAPKDFYPQKFRAKLAMVRVMLFISPLVFLIVCLI